MAEVTIKAQQSVGRLRAGDVVTVERSDYVDGLIERGRVAVVDDSTITDEGILIGDGEQSLPVRPADLPEPPKRSASHADWAEYLAEHVHVEGGTEGKTRAELLAIWDRFVELGTTATPAAEDTDAATDSDGDGTDGDAGDGTD